MNAPRLVRIERVRDSWLVFYVDRKKGQRYTAAQFYAKDFTIHQVANWIHRNPKLTLES